MSRVAAGAACPYPPSVLDFLPLRGLDASVVEESWPCEVRTFWVKDMQPFVSFVRFIYAYFTLLVVFIGSYLLKSPCALFLFPFYSFLTPLRCSTAPLLPTTTLE